MTFTMSSEGDSAKSSMLEPGDDKSGAEQTTDSSQDATDAKVDGPTENHEEKNAKGAGPERGAEAVEPDKQEEEEKKNENAKDEPEKPEAKPKSDDDDEDSGASKEDTTTTPAIAEKKEDDDKAVKDKTDDGAEVKKDEKEEKGAKEKDEDDTGEKEVPLLDQPLEQKGKRERKNVQRFNEEFTEHKDNVKVDFIPGQGTALGDIPRVDASISRFKNDDLKLLHRLLFKSMGKTTLIKKNIRKFNGFDFKKDSEEYTKKVNAAHKLEVKNLKSICEMLDLQKSGTKDEIINRVIDFLMEPKDSGRQVDGGRPKRTAAVRANNRGYSSHDDYSSDERATRARRDKGKRSNLKDDTSSDEDFQPNQSDASDDRSHSTKRKRRSQRKKSSDEESEASVATTDESDDEPKSKRKRSPVKANNRSKPKGTGRRGRPPASTKRPPTRPKKKAPSSDEESDKKDEGSSSEDEPLVKKAKSSQPPTDDEIKTFIKSILEGANLEEITMKTVCQRVYSNYPDFDLTHKKYFIKSTVKSLIST